MWNYQCTILKIQVAYSNYSENMSQDINEGNTHIIYTNESTTS